MIDRFIDGIGDRLIGLVPDWLVWIATLPNWLAALIAGALCYVAGRWGIRGMLAVLTLGIALFWLGRRSGSVQEPFSDHQRVSPPMKGQTRSGGLFRRFWRKVTGGR